MSFFKCNSPFLHSSSGRCLGFRVWEPGILGASMSVVRRCLLACLARVPRQLPLQAQHECSPMVCLGFSKANGDANRMLRRTDLAGEHNILEHPESACRLYKLYSNRVAVSQKGTELRFWIAPCYLPQPALARDREKPGPSSSWWPTGDPGWRRSDHPAFPRTRTIKTAVDMQGPRAATGARQCI